MNRLFLCAALVCGTLAFNHEMTYGQRLQRSPRTSGVPGNITHVAERLLLGVRFGIPQRVQRGLNRTLLSRPGSSIYFESLGGMSLHLTRNGVLVRRRLAITTRYGTLGYDPGP